VPVSDRTRRRFLADLLFAGGAVTAASMLGYVATHREPVAADQPTPDETPSACTPNVDMRPAGEMEPPRPAPSAAAPVPQREMQPPGLVAVPREGR